MSGTFDCPLCGQRYTLGSHGNRPAGMTIREARMLQHSGVCVGALPLELAGCPLCDVEVWCRSNEVDWYKRNHANIRHGAKW